MKKEDVFQKLMQIFHENQTKSLERSWCLQSPEERKFRLKSIIELSVELARAKEKTIFCAAFAEGVIESIIEGDWDDARQGAQMLKIEGESEEVRMRYAPIWENFVLLTEAFCAQAKNRTGPV